MVNFKGLVWEKLHLGQIGPAVAWSTDHFYRQGVQTPVDEFLQRIIHKAVAGHAGLSFELWGLYAHPEMAAGTGVVGAGVSGMLPTLVEHLEGQRRQAIAQALFQCGGGYLHGTQLLAPDSSPLRWGAM